MTELATLMIATLLLTQTGNGLALGSTLPVKEAPALLHQMNTGGPAPVAANMQLLAKGKADPSDQWSLE